MPLNTCPLCTQPEHGLLWHNDHIYVIAVDDALYPGYTRVIWRDHIAEMTQLPPVHRNELMDIIWQVEQTMRQTLQPTKINLAQFGNKVPHMHWHVIPRWQEDSHFPDAIWAPPARRTPAEQKVWAAKAAQISQWLPAYHAQLAKELPA